MGVPTFRWRPLLVLGALLALVLSGCTGTPDFTDDPTATGTPDGPATGTAPPGPDEWRRSVRLTPLTVPPEMLARADRLDLGGLVGGTTDKPALVAVIRTAPDGRRHLQVSSWDGAAWQPGDVGPGVPGEAQDVEVAGSPAVAALGGWTWESGTVWPYLLTSTNRRTWTPVQLPETLNGHRIGDVTVDDGRVVALAQNDAGDAATVVVDQAGAGEPAVTALPAVPDGQHRSLGAIAVAGDTVVVTGRQGPTDTNPLMVFRSSDAGRSWAEPIAITSNSKAGGWGIAALPGGFMVTGNDLIPGDPDENVQATAWFSPDGVAWTAETPPEPDGFRWEGHNSVLGAPTAAGDYVLVVAGASSSRSSLLYQRQPSGEWIAAAQTDQVADDAGRLGHVVPIVEPAGSEAPAGTFVGIAGEHGAVVGRLSSGVWTTQITPAMNLDPPYFSELVQGGQDWRAVIRQRHFGPFGNGGFHTWWTPTEVGLNGDALTVLPWDPPEAGEWEDVERGRDAAGAEVVLVNKITENDAAKVIGGWFRSASGQPWQPVSGFGAEPYEDLGQVIHLADRWFAWGGRRANVSDGEVQSMLWTSADGVTWARADGDFADADRSSTITDVCSDPAGRPVAVGWLYLTDDTPTAAAWSEHNGRWQRSVLPAGPEVRAWFSSCGTVNGQLVIEGTLDGDEQRWTIDAGGAFRPVAPPVVDADLTASSGDDDPFELTNVEAVPGGYVADGRLDTPAHTGPVIWLSADGSGWTWIPMPTAQPNASLLTRSSGADLIVLSGSTNYSQAWRIPDIASVIASIPADG